MEREPASAWNVRGRAAGWTAAVISNRGSHYDLEVRDDPDDLSIICANEAEARRRERRRAARIGQPVLIYEIDDRHGERFICTVD